MEEFDDDEKVPFEEWERLQRVRDRGRFSIP